MNGDPSIDKGKLRLARRVIGLTSWMMRLESWAAILMLVVLLVTMGTQVIARYVFRSPFSWSEELARFAMIWLAFIAASLVMARQEHIAVDIWAGRMGRWLPKRLTFAMDCIVYLIVVATCLLLLVGGLRFVWYVHPVGSPSLGIPKSLWYGAVSVGLGLMALHGSLNFLLLLLTGRHANSTGTEDASL